MTFGWEFPFECDILTCKYLKLNLLIVNLFSPLKLALSVFAVVASGGAIHGLPKLESLESFSVFSSF